MSIQVGQGFFPSKRCNKSVLDKHDTVYIFLYGIELPETAVLLAFRVPDVMMFEWGLGFLTRDPTQTSCLNLYKYKLLSHQQAVSTISNTK